MHSNSDELFIVRPITLNLDRNMPQDVDINENIILEDEYNSFLYTKENVNTKIEEGEREKSYYTCSGCGINYKKK